MNKSNSKYIIIFFAIVLSISSVIFLISDTFSKYVGQLSNSASIGVAAWNVLCNNERMGVDPITVTPELTYNAHEDIINGKIAPRKWRLL